MTPYEATEETTASLYKKQICNDEFLAPQTTTDPIRSY